MENITTDMAEERKPVWYITKEKSLVGNEVHEAGVKVQYAGLPAENLVPTCDEGRARYQEYLDTDKIRVAKMIENNQGPGALDPLEFMKNMIKVQADMAAEQDERRAEQAEKQAEKQTAAIAGAVAQAVTAALGAMFPSGVPVAAPVPVAHAPATAVTGATEVAKLEDPGATGKRPKV